MLAEAVQALFPGTQVTIGPVIDNGFYYDFYRETPFTPEDFAAIEKKMREIIGRDKAFTKEEWSRDEAKSYFEKKGEAFKIELVDMIPEDQTLKIYKQGEWLDLCRGPHMTSTGKIGSGLQADEGGGRLLARRFKPPDAQPHLRHGLGEAGRPRRLHQAAGRGRAPRPSPPRARMDLFHFQEEGPALSSGIPRAGRSSRRSSTTCAAAGRRGYIEVNTPQVLDRALWETSGHWQTYRENMFLTKTEDERVFRALNP